MERGNSPDLDDVATRRDYLFGAGSIAVVGGMAGCLGLGGDEQQPEESDGETGTNDSADEDAEDDENGDEDDEDDDADDDEEGDDDSSDDEDADAGDDDSTLEEESEDNDTDDDSSNDGSEDQDGEDDDSEAETNEDEEGEGDGGEANDGEGVVEDDETGDERTDGADENSDEDDAMDDDGDGEAEEEEDDEEEDSDETGEDQEEGDSSAAWYTNDEYGYELEYPAEWVVEEGDDYVQILDGDETARIWVEFTEISLDLDQGVRNYRETFDPNPGVEVHEDDPMTLSSGEEGHRFVIEITDTERNQIFAHELIAHANGIQYLTSVIISRSEYNEDYAQLAEEILASVALY